jgi:hypothetical protein
MHKLDKLTYKANGGDKYHLEELTPYKLSHKLRLMEMDSRIHAAPIAFTDKHESNDNAYRSTHASDHTVKSHSYCPTNAYNPTHTLCHTWQPKPNADKQLKPRELEHMYEKWGYKPHGLEHNIDGVYNTNRELRDGTQQSTQPEHELRFKIDKAYELREPACRQPNHRDAHTHFPIPTPIPHMHNIFNVNQQDHISTPATKPFPSVTYEDHRTPPNHLKDMYENTKVCKPWEFEDQLSKAPSYYNEPDILQEAHKGSHSCTELLLKKWIFVGSQL